jgi:site-specific recombinase XerD
LAPELAQGISRVKSVKSTGIRFGNWLSEKQTQALLSAPDITPVVGLRDRAILAVLLGCGLRRSEVAALTFAGHVQQRDGRWCIVDLVGKHGRVRTAWVKVATDAWTSASGVATGHIFRPVDRGGTVSGEQLGEKVVWQMLKRYAAEVGVPCIAPHDLRRTCAKLCRAAGGELEQIQLLLGHASVQTTERYLGTKQDLAHAPNDAIRLRVANWQRGSPNKSEIHLLMRSAGLKPPPDSSPPLPSRLPVPARIRAPGTRSRPTPPLHKVFPPER